MPHALPPKALIGVVHVAALPGTPRASMPLSDVIAAAREEAITLRASGFDAVMIENMHDRPYLARSVGPEIIAGMTAVTVAIRQAIDGPIGVQVLAGANMEALAVAQAGGADFIRAEGFVFAHVADEGILAEASAARLLRFRRQIGADHIAVYADVKKKHASHALTADVDLAETARAAEFFLADGIVVTGTATGQPTCPDDLRYASDAVSIPVLVGSGVTWQNLAGQWPHADGFIVGSCIKRDGLWSNPLDKQRIAQLIGAAEKLKHA